MNTILSKIKITLKERIIDSLEKAKNDGKISFESLPNFVIEQPADKKNGDLSSNIALAGAKIFKIAPRETASIIAENIDLSNLCLNEKIDIAGAGFLNFTFSNDFYTTALKEVLEQKENYIKNDFGKNEKCLVEFVSANPTGPMHMGNARGGAIGDCLASLLSACSFDVSREFYINDAGNQIEKFGVSLEARYLELLGKQSENDFPEDGYKGKDIIDRAQEFIDINGDKFAETDSETRRKALVDYAMPKNLEAIKNDLLKYRIEYDTWFSEKTLHEKGDVIAVVDRLKQKGATFEKDGATFFAGTKYGLEKDEVLIRQNGIPTYYAADIAYHENKFLRGFTHLIDIWGADHHGHVARIKAALLALGYNSDNLDIILMQLVHLLRDGEPVRMSKRTGQALALCDLLDEVSVDAARFFFAAKEASSQMEFDLGLAVKEDSQNPVYYAQYAAARVSSIMRAIVEQGHDLEVVENCDFSLLKDESELALITFISALEDTMIECAKDHNPAPLLHFAASLAALFHKFYDRCRILGQEKALMDARLYLCKATHTVLKSILELYKISVPEKM